MHFIKTDVSSRKFNEVNSKSKLFLWNKRLKEIFKLKKLHALAWVRRHHRWSLTVIHKKRLSLQLLFSNPFYKETDHCSVVGLFVPARSDWRQGTANESLLRTDIFFFGSWQSHNQQLINKNAKKCSDSSVLDTASEQSQVCSNPPLNRSLSPKWPMIRLSRQKWRQKWPQKWWKMSFFHAEQELEQQSEWFCVII